MKDIPTYKTTTCPETIETFTQKYFSGKRLNTDPHYQRELVWDPKKEIKLVDSILQSIPIGSIVLNEDTKTDICTPIDAKQRSTCLKHLMLDDHKIINVGTLVNLSQLREMAKVNSDDGKKAKNYVKRIEEYPLHVVKFSDLSYREQASIFDLINNGESLNDEQRLLGLNMYTKVVCKYLKERLKAFCIHSSYFSSNKCLDLTDVLKLLYCIVDDNIIVNPSVNRLSEAADKKNIEKFARNLNSKILDYMDKNQDTIFTDHALADEKLRNRDVEILFKGLDLDLKKVEKFLNALGKIINSRIERKGSFLVLILFAMFMHEELKNTNHLDYYKDDVSVIFKKYKNWIESDKDGKGRRTYDKIRRLQNDDTFKENVDFLKDEFKKQFKGANLSQRKAPTSAEKKAAEDRLKQNNDLCEWCNKKIDINSDKFDYDHDDPVGTLIVNRSNKYRILHSLCNVQRSNNPQATAMHTVI